MTATKRNLSTSSDGNDCSKKLHTNVNEEENLDQASANSSDTPDLVTGGTDDPSTHKPELLNEQLSQSENNTQMDSLVYEEDTSTQQALLDIEPDTSLYEDAIHNLDSLQPLGPDRSQKIEVPLNMLDEILKRLNDLKEDNKGFKEEIKTLREDNVYLKIKLDGLTTEIRSKTCDCTNSSGSTSVPPVSVNNRDTGHSSNAPVINRPTLDPNSLKQQVVPNWGRKFNYRRKQYKNYDKNKKRAELYRQFIDEESPTGLYIVKSLRPKFASDLRDYKIAEQLSINSMETQAKRWEGYADQAKNNIKSVDRQVSDLIKLHNIEEEKSMLLTKWESEIKNAEEKANNMNDSELEFMKNMPQTDPYSGYVESVSESRPNNRGFYKRHYYGARKNHHQSYHNNYNHNHNQNRGRWSNRNTEDQMDTSNFLNPDHQ